MKTIVDYAEKVKEQHALNKTLAPVETDLTSASQAYAVGQKFINNGVLYQAKTAIAQGAALVLNTNYEAADDVSSEIEALTNKLNNEIVTRSALGAKNILPFDLAEIKALNTNGTWAGNVYTYRGVAFTVNTDGTISATGTATGGNASIKLFAASSNYEMLGKEVILTGCPSNGSASTYRIQAYRMASADGSTGTYFDDGAGTDAFTVLNDASGTVGSFAVAVYENATVTNLLFKPMVRLASDPDATYQPYAKTNRELTAENQTLTNYANAQSNPNLFDNPWFTVNQRGFSTSVSGGAYGFDRWKGVYSYDSTNKGISFANVADWCQQVFEDSYKEFWDNTIMTMSVKYSDGSISFGTFTYKASGTGWTTIFNDEKLLAQLSATGDIGLTATAVCSIVAVKLEIGEISTLASDTAPNYATELLKCQRYFISFNPLAGTLANGGAPGVKFANLGVVAFSIPVPIALRAKPTLNISNYGRVYYADGTTFVPESIVVDEIFNNVLRVYVPVTSSADIKIAIWQDYKFTASADL